MPTENVPWTTAPEHVRRMVPRLDLSHDAWQTAYRLAREYDGDVDATPKSVAAGAVYAAGLLHNEKRTQAVVAEAAECSTPAIRRAYRQLLQADGYDPPPKHRPEPEPDADEPRWSVTLPTLPLAELKSLVVPMAVAMLASLWVMNSVDTEAFVAAAESIEPTPPFTSPLFTAVMAVVAVSVLLTFLGPVVRAAR